LSQREKLKRHTIHSLLVKEENYVDDFEILNGSSSCNGSFLSTNDCSTPKPSDIKDSTKNELKLTMALQTEKIKVTVRKYYCYFNKIIKSFF